MVTPITDARLAEIEAREKRATPSPWYCSDRGDGSGSVNPGTEADYDMDSALLDDGRCPYIRGEVRVEDGIFAAHARADVPDLVAEVKRLRAELKRYEWRPLSEIHEDYGPCVLIDIEDPGYMEVGSNLDMNFDGQVKYFGFTHFAEVPKLTTERAEQLIVEMANSPEVEPA